MLIYLFWNLRSFETFYSYFRCCHIFTVNYHSTLFLIIIIAIFIFIFIALFTINTIIVISTFTFKVYFLNFSYVPVVCVNLPDHFLRDHNRNKVFFAIVPHLWFIWHYAQFSLFWRTYWNIYLLDTMLCDDGRYSLLLTDLLNNVKHHIRLSFSKVLSLRKWLFCGKWSALSLVKTHVNNFTKILSWGSYQEITGLLRY